ncbi:regulatory protein [Colwellia chukchiensis]|uniref:Regulatory protein RecX n=1 Tax=Colwellia chukchiensis TaxID=641665 RepID=A0A1H7IW01_9GAMM|nr:regulatory protein RecX [Colwellia chukchiensis]SEK64965.1 regulatory protein [Colwellia chukchiensis]
MNKALLKTAMALISRREHSYYELAQKLRLRDYSSDEINVVLDDLIARNYVNDKRFADSVFRRRVEKGYGYTYIKNELVQKGVSENIAQELARNYQIDWYLQAELAYNKRFGASLIKDQKDKAKRLRFMQQRGFSLDEIMTLLHA